MSARTLGEILRKSAPPLPLIADRSTNDDGSFEHTLTAIADAVLAAVPCTDKVTRNASGAIDRTDADGPIVARPHALRVVETFSDCAIVKCEDESKVWRVGFVRDDDGTFRATGCEEQIPTFRPVQHGFDDEHGGYMKPTIEQILAKSGDGVNEANEHRKLNEEIDALDQKIKWLAEHTGQFTSADIDGMSDEQKKGLKTAHDLKDHFLAERAVAEQKRARLWDQIGPQSIAKRANLGVSANRLAAAQARAGDLRDGRIRASKIEADAIRIELHKAEILHAEARRA